MKRFFGGVLALAGGVAVIWGAVHLLSGTSDAKVTLGEGVSVNALSGGLIGLAALTLGLIWARD
jgi:hypothetical protein